jgi:simple sugar transport system substrate-binding protein
MTRAKHFSTALITTVLMASSATALVATGASAADIAVVGGRTDDEFWNRIKKGVDDARLVVEQNGGSVSYLQLQT